MEKRLIQTWKLADEDLKNKNDELELKLIEQEETFSSKIKILEEEIKDLKMNQTRDSQYSKLGHSNEKEVAQYSVENENLKKKLNQAISEGKKLNNEYKTLRENHKGVLKEKQTIYDELINVKVF